MERAPDLRDTYIRWLEGLSACAFAAPEQFAWTGEGASIIGSDPGEWFTGPAARAALDAIVRAFRATGLRLTPGDPHAYREGSIGWVVDRTTLRTPVGPDLHTRMTAIFRREGGEWRLVHVHHSLGVPNPAS